MRLIYVCHPLANPSVEENVKIARKIVDQIIKEQGGEVLPFAPHLYFPQVMNDNEPAERQLGMEYSMYFLRKADEVWVYGDRISEGMKRELEEASGLKLPILFMDVPQ